MLSTPLALGAPGVYLRPETSPPPLTGVPMDVCAFVGVAPRGPAWEVALDDARPDRPWTALLQQRRRSIAVAVESFADYRRLYGGFEGPGRLPYAVAAFFDQGGRKAYVVRIVAPVVDPARGAATGELHGVKVSAGVTPYFAARNPGTWGNALAATLTYSRTPLSFQEATVRELIVDADERLPAGSLLRLRLGGGAHVLRFAALIRREGRGDAGLEHLRITLDQPLVEGPEAAEIVEGVLTVDDGDGRVEHHERLGLSSSHPRWLAAVLTLESELLLPGASWVDGHIVPDSPDLTAAEAEEFKGGEDYYPEIVPDDFLDRDWTLGDEQPGAGVHALVQLPDLASVVVPDLYVPEPLPTTEAVLEEPSLAGPRFELCVDPPLPGEQESAPPELSGLLRDPRLPGELEEIISLQARLVELAGTLRRFLVLLDVPPGLGQRQIMRWRARFRSSFAAAYHPWLRIARADDRRDALLSLNPAAVAAGIIANQERLFGLSHGPANAMATGVVDVLDRVSPARHDELHLLGINVYLRERDGVRLTAARTLSRDLRYRQLSVCRLLLMLRRTLEQQTHWMVFEPNGPRLWADVRNLLRLFLRQLYQAGAFTGATEEEAFFVRCSAETNPPRVVDAGQMVAEIGVALSEPIEFIVLRLNRGDDGTLKVEV
ncbi:phage tail sheath C-terminal domain-containing protein [Nitrococcus mobilis]|uniref:Phage tail sheath protein FI-like n=1 Tax=Nitrococcus mobilis Nb-231 TaxID=314278 RepID=A4BR14_9GAMM|nr:phage tail sheath C-terminal domain-containing protein [Nitrococcus mobilis]EAR22014.1 Phage tail sheath protein FI-like [Nitrococcus mobilis Nb-231]